MTPIQLALAVTLTALTQLGFAVELKQLPAHVGGRVLETKAVNGDKIYEYSWPSIYFETAFVGDSLTLRFDDDQNNFQLLINDQQLIAINKPGKNEYPVPGLTNGKHHIRLEKISETQHSSGRFLGFYSDDKPLTLKPRKRQIEFIGDSYTVGYGNTAKSRECNDEQLFNTTNSQLAFGPLVAKHFNADYQINASSGFGVVRNYNGINPEKNLIAIYPFALQHNHFLYTNHWQPQVIVIGLGTNDFSTKLNNAERWKTREQLQQDYINKYVEFVKALARKNPKAHFVLMASTNAENEIANNVTKVLEQLKTSGMKKIDSIIFSGLDFQGCHWHPSVKDSEILAKTLTDYLVSKKVW